MWPGRCWSYGKAAQLTGGKLSKMDVQSVILSKPAVNIALMLGMKFFGINPPAMVARVAFGVCMAAHILLLLFMLHKIRSGQDGAAFKAKVIDSQNQKCAPPLLTVCAQRCNKHAPAAVSSLPHLSCCIMIECAACRDARA